MKKLTTHIQNMLTLHGKWLRGEGGGARADLSGADLSGADLTGADLSCADLSGADLSGADLTGADLSGAALPYSVPVVADLPVVLSAAVTGDNLDMGLWHSCCDSTHCRAGWIVRQAGEAGEALEAEIGCNAAAALIYSASCQGRRVPDWYASAADALADIRREAEEWTKLETKGKK